MQHLARIPVLLTLFALTSWTTAQELAWARAIGAEGDDVAQSLAVDQDGNVIVVGYFEGTVDLDPGMGEEFHTSSGANDIFVQKLDNEGVFIWGWGLGGADADYATGVSVDADGNIYVCGTFNGTVDFDPSAGITELVSTGGYDIFLAKYEGEGVLVWARGSGSVEYDEPKTVAVGPLGSVYLLSYFSATLDADPGTAQLPITSAGALDILVQRFDADGGLLWANSIGSAGTDLGLSMALDADENIWFTGSFENTLDLDPGAAAFPLTSAGAWDIFVSKWSAGGTFMWAGRMGGSEISIRVMISLWTPWATRWLLARSSAPAISIPGQGSSCSPPARWAPMTSSCRSWIRAVHSSGRYPWAAPMPTSLTA